MVTEEGGLDKKFVIVAMNTEIEQGLEVYYLVEDGASNRWRCREKRGKESDGFGTKSQ